MSDRDGPNLTAAFIFFVFCLIALSVLLTFFHVAGVIDLGEWRGELSRWLDQ